MGASRKQRKRDQVKLAFYKSGRKKGLTNVELKNLWEARKAQVKAEEAAKGAA